MSFVSMLITFINDKAINRLIINHDNLFWDTEQIYKRWLKRAKSFESHMSQILCILRIYVIFQWTIHPLPGQIWIFPSTHACIIRIRYIWQNKIPKYIQSTFTFFHCWQFWLKYGHFVSQIWPPKTTSQSLSWHLRRPLRYWTNL